jgi:hypothetical protein
MEHPLEGYLYLLQHPNKPDVVGKIGRTRRTPQQRLAEHNVRGLPGEIALESGKPWKLMHYVPVIDASKAEAWVWDYLCVPKFNNIELQEIPLDAVMEAVKACHYVDKEKYAAMLLGELRDYDISVLLDSIRIARERETAKWKVAKKRVRASKAGETRQRNTGFDT